MSFPYSFGYALTTGRVKVGAPPKIEHIPSDLHLSEGDNTKIKIKWSGDLPFEVELFRNDVKVSESSSLKMTVFDEFLIIFMREISKDMGGKYTIKVSNESGTASDSFMVFISGLPGPPIGPLDCSEITSHTCTLNW